ncbi:MAG: IPT/TIG domain-containing protein, partial [Pseudomonadota bacterium]
KRNESEKTMRRFFIALVTFCFAQTALAQKPAPEPPKKAEQEKPPAQQKAEEKTPAKENQKAPMEPGANWQVRKPPVVNGFEPKLGAPNATVTITGDHFDNNTSIHFNGQPLKVTSFTENQLIVTIPTRAVTDRFVVSKPGFPNVVASDAFQVIRPPYLHSFSPQRGDPGVLVTIKGANFLSSDEVVLGNTSLPIQAITPTHAVVKIPSDATTAQLGIRRGTSVLTWSKQAFQVNLPPPVISGFSPKKGEVGTLVRISGNNFNSTDYVELGDQRVVIRNRGPNFFEVVVGKQPSGPFAVKGEAQRSTISKDHFNVVGPPVVRDFAPNSGSPGTRITFQGMGFESSDQVFIDSALLTVRTVSSTQIVAELPAGVNSGKLSIKRGSTTYPISGIFQVILPPTITNISPTDGPPGTKVQIVGTNFSKRDSVLLSGMNLPIVGKRLPNELSVKIPPKARTGRIVVVSDSGSANSPTHFQVTPFASLSSFFPISGLSGTQVAIRGENFHPGIRVYLGTQLLNEPKISPTTITVTIPTDAMSGKFIVETFGQKKTTRIPFTVLKPKPALSFTVSPSRARRGEEVTIELTPPSHGVAVYFDDRLLPSRVIGRGRQLIVTIPGNANSGFFELEYNGERFRSPTKFKVR